MWGRKAKYFIFFIISLTLVPLFANDKELFDKVEKAVNGLGAESFKDREKASSELFDLVEKNEILVEKLKKFLNHKDPEGRIRIKDILKQFSQILKWMDPANEKILKSQRNGKTVKLTFLNRQSLSNT